MISARRACLSRTFRSSIRFAVSVFFIDRNYSAAREALTKGESLSGIVRIMYSVARFSNKENIFMLNVIPLAVGALIAVAIIVIGGFYLLSPGLILGSFGLKPPASDADTRAWLRLKGVRDITAGLVLLTMC